MRIAICDSDLGFSARLKSIIYSYADKHRLDIVVDRFTCGEELLSATAYYSIIFLGYVFSGMNGLVCAEKLRNKGVNSHLIFISDFSDFVFDAFKVQALGFLLKSECEKRLISVLDQCLLKSETQKSMLVKSGDDQVRVDTKDIYYLEADNKHCFIHLKKEVVECNQTMAKVYSFLPRQCFSKANRAYVVNLDQISRYNNDVIIMKNGKALHPSRNYYKSFKEEYRRFLTTC